MGWLIGAIFFSIAIIEGVVMAFIYNFIPELIMTLGLFAGLDFFFIVKYKKYRELNADMILKKKEKKQEKQQRQVAAECMAKSLNVTHQAGLPLAQDSPCTISESPEAFNISGSGNDFLLKHNKITDIAVKTDIEIQKQYVSSIGGAVAGAAFFGPLGAIVGGRAKQKKSQTVTYYLIFTYRKDEEILYISFEVPFYELKKANAIKNEFAARMNSRPHETIEL